MKVELWCPVFPYAVEEEFKFDNVKHSKKDLVDNKWCQIESEHLDEAYLPIVDNDGASIFGPATVS